MMIVLIASFSESGFGLMLLFVVVASENHCLGFFFIDFVHFIDRLSRVVLFVVLTILLIEHWIAA